MPSCTNSCGSDGAGLNHEILPLKKHSDAVHKGHLKAEIWLKLGKYSNCLPLVEALPLRILSRAIVVKIMASMFKNKVTSHPT